MAIKFPLSEVVLVFPTEEHVEKVCKPGQGAATCRYLTSGDRGWSCAKTSSLRRMIDKRTVEGTMKAKGDNCGGLLGVIMEKQNELVGKKIEWRETSPTYEEAGLFRRMEVKDSILHITADWGERGEDRISFSITDLEILVAPGVIIFGIAGLGSFAGKASISLN